LESCGEQFAGVMPRLQQLKAEGVSFSRCYANSWRTDRGTVCALSGYPSFPSLSVMKMPEKSRRLPAIAQTLRAQGYTTRYIYGGDINFTNMRSYLIGTGWEQLTSMDDYTAEERRSAQWGVRDDITFRTVENLVGGALATRHTEQRVLVGYSTLSSHEPWDVPGERRNDDEVLNAFGYLDECLWEFVERMKASPAWENLLIVLTADHGINHGGIDQSRPMEKNHIPMVWIGGAVRGPREVSTICNQNDLAATLLGQMGLGHDDFLFSRDVLSETYRHPVAVHNYNNAQWAIDSTGHCLYDFDAQRFIVSEGLTPDSLLKVSKAMLQVTTEDLK
jgi:phosphoglycerol transferase MdoB-like AlkP superfamily enzyme